MRKLKGLALLTGLLGGVALLLSACASPATPTPAPTPPPTPVVAPAAPKPATPAPTPSATPKSAGELRLALSYLGVEALDPILGPSSSSGFLDYLYDGLVGVTPQGQFSPETGLAQKWQVSADKKTWTFSLRKGIRFHNGDEVTAEDVKFSIERFMSPKSVSTFSRTLRSVIDRIETPDPYTVVVYTKEPYAFLHKDLSSFEGSEGFALPKKYIQEKGDDYFNAHPVGTGPYRFVEQVVGSYMLFEAVENHWSGVVPKFKRLMFFLIPEESTRIAMLKVGQADIIEVSREKIKELAGFNVFGKPGESAVGVWMENQWETETYLSSKKVREALNLAINRQEMLEHLFAGKGTISYTFYYQTFTVGYQPVAPYPFDPAKAKQLLAEAYPAGVKLDVYSFNRPGVSELPKVGEVIAGYLDKVGVKTKIIPTEYGTYRAKKEKGILPNTIGPMATSNRPFIGGVLRTSWHSKGLLQMVKDPKLDALIEVVEAAKDLEQLGEAHVKWAQYVRDNHLAIGLVEVDAVYAANTKKVKEWDLGSLSWDLNLVRGLK